MYRIKMYFASDWYVFGKDQNVFCTGLDNTMCRNKIYIYLYMVRIFFHIELAILYDLNEFCTELD